MGRIASSKLRAVVTSLTCVGLAGATGLGCGPTVSIDEGGSEATGDSGSPDDTTVGTTVGTNTTPAEDETGPLDDTGTLTATNEVDILFVIDNSGAMSEEQANLANAAAGFVDILGEAGLNYRIAMTTTDNGNPWCSGTTPEGGSFRLSSCRERLSEFVLGGDIDLSGQACLDVCGAETVTTTPAPAEAMGKPWIEVTDGVSNLEGLSVGEALACALPQGLNGCGFEQPLESMYKAIVRSQTDNESEFGFLRPGAMQVIIIVSDEADCSYQQETIFLPDDDRTFWSGPDSEFPSSAVCWRAGVECARSDCASVNLDPLGQETSEANASMRPVSRYVDKLQELEDLGQAVTPGVEVVVELIGGFAPDGSVVYADTMDEQFMADFGIGPGCDSDGGPAVPMLRAREVGEAMSLPGAQTTHSICAASLQPTLTTIAGNIVSALGV